MDNETERDRLRHSLETIDAIRAGRWKPDPTDPLTASRLAILDAVEAPAGKTPDRPQLRVIQGGKAD
ncbi:hypothetical protein ACIU1J_05485 [Azospirillum doebereinerae]|uniref:hypothetical protein n=1 Tax=Azospirillum doebereinerae TaxID=92933 RepID=UPI001EE5A161|nr:hypothetical protein [Azospirillum doebereinerae]MCG5240868.1 hypothetical protein [Azospirillum doebereinerae]